jgi:hypothetical protein
MISWAAWIGRGLVKVQSSSMQFVALDADVARQCLPHDGPLESLCGRQTKFPPRLGQRRLGENKRAPRS